MPPPECLESLQVIYLPPSSYDPTRRPFHPFSQLRNYVCPHEAAVCQPAGLEFLQGYGPLKLEHPNIPRGRLCSGPQKHQSWPPAVQYPTNFEPHGLLLIPSTPLARPNAMLQNQLCSRPPARCIVTLPTEIEECRRPLPVRLRPKLQCDRPSATQQMQNCCKQS